MMNRKRIAAIAGAGTLALSLVGCTDTSGSGK